jgi:hypothetical protein
MGSLCCSTYFPRDMNGFLGSSYEGVIWVLLGVWSMHALIRERSR